MHGVLWIIIQNPGRADISAAQWESSLFSSSFSEIFSRKSFESLEELEAKTIGNLLPPEDNLFSGINNLDDLEDFDLFSSTVVGHPSRTLFVRNINSNVEDSELKAILRCILSTSCSALFEFQYGDIRTLYTACKHRGFVMISYYDIRAARNAMNALQNKPLRRRKLDIHYSIPKEIHQRKIEPGHSMVFNLDSSVSIDEICQIFGVHGEIKEVIDHHKFIEYYDIRDAEAALSALNRSEIAGKQIKVETSLLGALEGISLMKFLMQQSEHEQTEPHLFKALSCSSPQMCHMFPGRNSMISMHHHLVSPNERVRNLSHRRIESNSNHSDKKLFELDIDCILRGEDNRTTLMIKNIPNKYTSKMLLAAIDDHCRGTYDFIYLPIDFKNKCNVGYAFINMIDPQQIIPFHKVFDGKKWEKFNSEKVAYLAYARIQGKAALIAHFQNSSLMNEDKRCRPILFHTDGPNAGDPEPFPTGTHIRSRLGKPRSTGNEENHHIGSPSTLANEEESPNGIHSSPGSDYVVFFGQDTNSNPVRVAGNLDIVKKMYICFLIPG
ncbi:protein MEI [Salix suchowensis]|nr:protein MEI [Salix suchowensis]